MWQHMFLIEKISKFINASSNRHENTLKLTIPLGLVVMALVMVVMVVVFPWLDVALSRRAVNRLKIILHHCPLLLQTLMWF